MRKLKIYIPIALILTILATIQPHYLIQIFSFMEDGFSYEILLCSFALLGIFAIESSDSSIIGFMFSILLLLGTKYSNLPIILILSVCFVAVFLHKILHKKIQLGEKFNFLVFSTIIIGIIFLYMPYVYNIIQYHYFLYPSNLTEIVKSYSTVNVPLNIRGENRFNLLFYGIFSKSQVDDSSNDNGPLNVAKLKIPLTFSISEITNSTEMYNNRVGAGGPLFSGIFLLSILTLLILYITSSINQRKYVYLTFIIVLLIILSVLASPSPNVFRFNGQILLIPFVIVVAAITLLKQKKSLIFIVYGLILLMVINMLLFSLPMLKSRFVETSDINKQLSQMKHSNKIIDVNAKEFYSDYVRLEEYGIKFKMMNELTCKNPQILLYTAYTTQFCLN